MLSGFDINISFNGKKRNGFLVVIRRTLDSRDNILLGKVRSKILKKQKEVCLFVKKVY